MRRFGHHSVYGLGECVTDQAARSSRRKVSPGTKLRLRSDSAGYRLDLMDYCRRNKIGFTITADLDAAVVVRTASRTDIILDAATGQGLPEVLGPIALRMMAAMRRV